MGEQFHVVLSTQTESKLEHQNNDHQGANAGAPTGNYLFLEKLLLGSTCVHCPEVAQRQRDLIIFVGLFVLP